jgi:hypothetical protein
MNEESLVKPIDPNYRFSSFFPNNNSISNKTVINNTINNNNNITNSTGSKSNQTIMEPGKIKSPFLLPLISGASHLHHPSEPSFTDNPFPQAQRASGDLFFSDSPDVNSLHPLENSSSVLSS